MKKDKVYNVEVLEKAAEILNNFAQFTDGVRVLFLIHRSKEGGASNGSKLKTFISKTKEELHDNLYEMLLEKARREEPTRIYLSANARSMQKAIRQFKQNMLDNDYNPPEVMEGFYYDMKNRWISSLMKPSSRSRNSMHFIFDCDSEEETETALDELRALEMDLQKVLILKIYPTRNGTHIVTLPFDPSKTPLSKEKIHKDGLLLIHF